MFGGKNQFFPAKQAQWSSQKKFQKVFRIDRFGENWILFLQNTLDEVSSFWIAKTILIDKLFIFYDSYKKYSFQSAFGLSFIFEWVKKFFQTLSRLKSGFVLVQIQYRIRSGLSLYEIH